MPFMSRMPKSCTSPLSRNHCPTAPSPRSRKTAPLSNTPRPSTSSCHCRASQHADSRILPFSSEMVSDSKGASPKKRKQDVLVGRRVLHKVLVPLKATSVKFRGRWHHAKEVPHSALFSVPSSSFVLIVALPLIILRPRPRTKRSKYS